MSNHLKTSRERGAGAFEALSKATDPEERNRLAQQLDDVLMSTPASRRLLSEALEHPEGSDEERQAFSQYLNALHDAAVKAGLPFKPITTVDEARALIASVDAAEASGVEFTDENMREFGYVQNKEGIWELPIPTEILRQL